MSRWWFREALDFRPARAQKSFRKWISDERARANFGSEVALSVQFVESEVDRESGNSEIGGQSASGGKARRVIAKIPGD